MLTRPFQKPPDERSRPPLARARADRSSSSARVCQSRPEARNFLPLSSPASLLLCYFTQYLRDQNGFGNGLQATRPQKRTCRESCHLRRRRMMIFDDRSLRSFVFQHVQPLEAVFRLRGHRKSIRGETSQVDGPCPPPPPSFLPFPPPPLPPSLLPPDIRPRSSFPPPSPTPSSSTCRGDWATSSCQEWERTRPDGARPDAIVDRQGGKGRRGRNTTRLFSAPWLDSSKIWPVLAWPWASPHRPLRRETLPHPCPPALSLQPVVEAGRGPGGPGRARPCEHVQALCMERI